MLDRLKKKKETCHQWFFFNHIWDLSSCKSGLFNWQKLFLDSQNPFNIYHHPKEMNERYNPLPLEDNTGGSGEHDCISKSGQSARLYI